MKNFPKAPTQASNSLTDRYVHAVTRHLPESQRDDVARELRASIEDQCEAALAEDPTLTWPAAEEQALIALGNPGLLASRYRENAQYLIGPETYPAYVTVLRTLLIWIVPIVTLVVVVAQAIAEDSSPRMVASLIGTALGTAISVAAQVALWTTIGFAVAERTGAGKDVQKSLGLIDWTPDDLPELPHPARTTLTEAVSSVAMLAAVGGLVVWQQVQPPVVIDGERFPVLDPDLWSFWIPVLLAMLVLEALFEIVKYRRGTAWTLGFAGVNALAALVFTAPVLYLASQDQLINPDLSAQLQTQWADFDAGVAHQVIFAGAIVVWAIETFDGWSKAVRA